MQMYHSLKQLFVTWESNQNPALIFGDDRKIITYSELSALVCRAAHEIRKSGIRSELIVTDHEPSTLIRVFACVAAGCDVVLVDESTPDESLFMLAKIAGTESIYASDPDLLDELCNECGCSPHTVRDADSEMPSSADADGEGRLIFFTSGTTGSQRAVVLTSRSLLASSYSGQCMLSCGQNDVILSMLPISHVFGFVCSLLWGLAYGAAVALSRGARYVLSDCEFFRPTILPVVPSLLRMLMLRHALPASLRVVLIGAAPLDADSVKALQSAGTEVYLGYGLTETSSGLAITQNQEDPFALFPCPGADIRIEPDGEISVETPCMMEGYLDLSASSDAYPKQNGSAPSHPAVLGHPVMPVAGGRLYTGDLGTLDKCGALRLTGRKKDMLVLPDGTKIYCPEYEEELSGILGLTDLAVILKNDRPVLVIGENEYSKAENIDNLIGQFNEKRARGLQICDIIYYGHRLPRTSTGKLRRWEIEKSV